MLSTSVTQIRPLSTAIADIQSPKQPSPAAVSLPQSLQSPVFVQLTQRLETLSASYLSPSALPTQNDAAFTMREVTASGWSDEELMSRIAIAYGIVCTDLWRLATAAQSSPQELSRHFQQLCILWLKGQQQIDCPLSAQFSTPTAARQAFWRSPIIQQTLQRTTAQLQAGPTAAFITAYPTDWAYACGLVANPLLQWNHRLASPLHREFLNQPPETAEASP